MDLFEYLLAMKKGGGAGGAGSSAVYSGKDIVYDSVGQYAYVSTATFPKLKDNDIYFVTETYTSNGYTFKKGSIYVLTQGTGDEFDATLLNEQGITYEPYIDVAKGDIISMNLDGTDRQYRIIKLNEFVAEVVGMFDIGAATFNSQPTYADGVLDNYLNSTYYASFNETAKSAIIDRTLPLTSWKRDGNGNPVYNGKRVGSSNYQVSLYNASYNTPITRHIYALSIQDVLDYLGTTPEMTYANTTLTKDNLVSMFWGSSTPSGRKWLRTMWDGANAAFSVDPSDGMFYDDGIVAYVNAVPAFQIDLSKIPYTKV